MADLMREFADLEPFVAALEVRWTRRRTLITHPVERSLWKGL